MKSAKYLVCSLLVLIIASCASSEDGVEQPTVPTISQPSATSLVVPTVMEPEPTASETPLPTPTQTPAPPLEATPSRLSTLGEHQVQTGETLSCIGRGYGVLPQAIANANGIELTSILHIGQLLIIPAEQWPNLPPGPSCAPQFPSPFPGLPVTGPLQPLPHTAPTSVPENATPLPSAVATSIPEDATPIPTLPIPDPPSPTPCMSRICLPTAVP